MIVGSKWAGSKRTVDYYGGDGSSREGSIREGSSRYGISRGVE